MAMTVDDSKKGRLIIVDPSLKDTRGHHYALTRVIADSAINSGFDVVVFSNRLADALLQMPGVRIRPVFSKATYDYFGSVQKNDQMSLMEKTRLFVWLRFPERFKTVLRKIRSKSTIILIKFGVSVNHDVTQTGGELLDELLDALVKENVTSVGHVLVHTADGVMYRTILQLLQKKYPLGKYPSFHLCTPYDTRIMPHSARGMPVDNVIKYLQLLGFIGRNVFLYAENELLADSLTNAWGVEVSALDIPMKKNVLLVTAPCGNESIFRVVYLGAAREEKGFHLIPDVIETVLNQIAANQHIEFVIQCSPQIVGYTRKIEATIEKLQEFSGREVKLIQKQQSEDEYYSILESSDVVLCCYQLENYRVRGSGVATEAVVYGKTVIATPGTYPEWLAGNAVFSATGSKEIAAAILSIIENRSEYHTRAKERAEWFFDKTRPDEYVNKLLDREKCARKNDVLVKKSESSILCQDLGGIPKSNINTVTQDDTNPENKYNVELCRAAVSSDGKLLFVKQISK